LLCCRWQALSRSLERVTAVHGDEGDDQHGLKVHEVHDMQPGLPISHRVDTTSMAVGLLPVTLSLRSKLDNSALGQDVPEALGLRSSTCAAELADAAGVVQTDKLGTALKLPVAVDNAVAVNTGAAMAAAGQRFKADAELQQSASEIPTHGMIDLCSQEERQALQPQLPEHHTSQLLAGDAGKVPLECSTMDKQPHSQQLEFSLDSAEQVSLSQAGKADLAELHDRRPAGITLDPPAEYFSHMGSKAGGSAQQLTSISSALSGDTAQQPPAVACAEAAQLVQKLASKSGQGQQQPQGMHTHIKALLRRQEGGGEVGKEAGGCEAAQALTQAEVIEAQTADQEKPSVSLRHVHV